MEVQARLMICAYLRKAKIVYVTGNLKILMSNNGAEEHSFNEWLGYIILEGFSV